MATIKRTRSSSVARPATIKRAKRPIGVYLSNNVVTMITKHIFKEFGALCTVIDVDDERKDALAEADVFVGTGFANSPSMIAALGYRKPIVTQQWVLDSVAAKDVQDTQRYLILHDAAFTRRYPDHPIPNVLERAINNEGRLFAGMEISVIGKTCPHMASLEKVAVANGAKKFRSLSLTKARNIKIEGPQHIFSLPDSDLNGVEERDRVLPMDLLYTSASLQLLAPGLAAVEEDYEDRDGGLQEYGIGRDDVAPTLSDSASPNNAISRAAAPALGAVDIGTAEAAIAVTDNMLADEAYRRAAKAEENVAVERAAHRETAAELRMEQDRRMAAEKKLTEIEAQLEAFKERGSVTAERRITELEAQVGALRGQFEAQVGAVQGQFEAQARAFQEQRRAAERKVTELEDQVDALNETALTHATPAALFAALSKFADVWEQTAAPFLASNFHLNDGLALDLATMWYNTVNRVFKAGLIGSPRFLKDEDQQLARVDFTWPGGEGSGEILVEKSSGAMAELVVGHWVRVVLK